MFSAGEGSGALEGTVIQYDSGATYFLLERKLECSACGRSTACLVNRDGRTRCYDCDAAYQERKAHIRLFGAA